MSLEPGSTEGESDANREGSETTAAQTGWSIHNWEVVAVFIIGTLVGIVITTDAFGLLEVTVPPFVLFYSGLGALGYIFTKLMVQFDNYADWGQREELVGMAMRIPAAWILAIGVYLFLGQSGQPGAQSGTLAAGVSFLVGLYVNVAHKALGSLADRVIGQARRGDDG
ncbi:MAG: hypothetical protein V5A38_13780 [Halolamina sp.]|uniref:hypothetical protein n=1 Tax=Halolamina sp. TaxID=1940283 RepID=UPI002FC31541